jgi:hypothetical protein
MRRINCHPGESDKDGTPESISATEDWLNWNGNLDIWNDTEDDCAAQIESDIEQGKGIEAPECPLQRNVSTVPNIPGLIRPTCNLKRQADKVLVALNAIKTRRN